jgi:phosphoglycolate phosphatase-like HAD superfamily hydrolase
MRWTLRAVAGHYRRVGDKWPSPIRHVLFDADGVLQDVPGGWESATEPYLGDRTMEFLRRVWNDELAALAGQSDLLPLVAAALADFGVTAPLEEAHRAIWLRIEPFEQTVELVRALRRNVAGAREAGLAAEQWTFADGQDALHAFLAKHGVAAS